ncbi:hypothetical protein ISM_07185 [Roseovarius nubinhibens ISM]|uniref:Uncharacterized protein n=1 Tax=Roseovarius nubinhibens (strain ATCC BAA-591 / DSM 15170 / ISM) TaxID=89187 RepID=A3SL29_ROSNI|nr:hypothetical protein ISM_07185 [Roseovarius nubinhibens ISM]
MDHPLERPRPEHRVIALIGQPFARRIVEIERDLPRRQPFEQTPHLDRDDPGHILALEPVKDDRLVEPVEELGPEMRPHRIHHVALGVAGIGPVGQLAQRLRPKVRSQDDQRLLEIHGAALTIGQHAIIEHLQQHVEHIRVGLFHLVEQHHLIGSAPHRLGEDTALVIADIARRRADQTGHRMFLHELRHVDAHHGAVVVKEELGHRLGELGLADTGRPEEQERAQRPVLVIEPGARPAHRIGHGLHRLVLADHPTMQVLFHPQKLLALALEHLCRRNPGPAFDHLRDLLGPHRLFDHDAIGLGTLGLRQLLFQPRNHAIAELTRLGEITLALGMVELYPRPVELFLEVPRPGELVPLGLPLRGHLARSLLQIRQLFLELLETVLRRDIILFLERLRFDLLLQDLTVERVKLFGLAVHLHPQPAGGLVHQVDRLVRQEPVGDIAMAERRGGHQGAVRNPHPMVQLVFLLDAAQDADRVLDRRLLHHDGLEPPRQRRVLLHMLAIFIERGGPDTMQLAARQRRLDQIGRIHRAIRFPGPDERVHLVDKENDLARRIRHLVEHGFEPLFEFATVFRPSDERPHVERQQPLVGEALGHIAIDDAQRQPLGDGGLADPRLADEHRVVLGAARQNLHGAANFIVAANDRIDLALVGGPRQVARIFLERLIGVLGAGTVGGAPLADIIDRFIELLRADAAGLERLFRRALDHGKRRQNALDRHETVTRLLGELFGLGKDLAGLLIHIGLARVAGDDRDFRDGDIQGLNHPCRLAARAFDQVARKPLVIIHQCFQYMFGRQLLMAFPHGDRLRCLNKATRPLGELFKVHPNSPL